MKIVISGYVGKKITGIGRNLIELLAHTSGENEYVVYTNYDIAASFCNLPTNICVKTYDKSKNDSLGNLLWTAFVFPKKAKEEEADVALIPNFTLLLFKYLPTAVIMHDLIEFNVPEKFSKLKMFYRTKLADPITAKRADSIMTVSENSKNDLIKYLSVPKDKISIVYNGVNREVFKRVPQVEYSPILDKFGITRPYLLYAGTIDHPGKNAFSLIKAFEIMCSGGYEGVLVLAGMPGSCYEIIDKTISESPYFSKIVVTGYVEDKELISLYSGCQVFCFLSLYEGFGIPPLEALSCYASVVVSDTSSLPEVIGKCGYVVDPLDINEIALTLSKAIKSPLSSSEIDAHLKNFDWSDLSKQFEEFIAKTPLGNKNVISKR